jgi:biopolymer transport protein ExbB
MDLSLWKVITTGGPAMYVILALSVLAIAVAIERAAAVWRYLDRARALSDTVSRCLGRGAIAEARTACERSKSPLADVFLVGFERLGRGSTDALESAVDRARQRITLDLKARLWVLGTIGATAPFIGLFGTVVGIMGAFGAIHQAGGGGINVVSKGLSEALITTAAGILVELKMLVDEFLEALETRPTSASSTGEAKDVAGQTAG